MNSAVQSAAWRLRASIESGMGASFEIADLVLALGGSTMVLTNNADKPHIVAAYLVALVLEQTENGVAG